MVAQQVESTAEEVSHEITVTVRFLVEFEEPVEVSIAVSRGDSASTHERWIPHDGIEAGVLAVEDFRKLDSPVERRDRGWIAAQGGDFGGGALVNISFHQVFGEPFGKFNTFLLTDSVLVGAEEGGDPARASNNCTPTSRCAYACSSIGR